MHREIKQAAIHFIIAMVLLCSLGALLYQTTILPNLLEARTLVLIHQLEKAIDAYQADYGSLPRSKVSLLSALEGRNAESKDYLADIRYGKVSDGKILDPFGLPLHYLAGDSQPHFFSSGADMSWGTEDDLSLDDLAKISKNYQLKPREKRMKFSND